MGPFVVSASKSGAVDPNRNFFCSTPSTALPILAFLVGGSSEILAKYWDVARLHGLGQIERTEVDKRRVGFYR
jgi:hypothetical protein